MLNFLPYPVSATCGPRKIWAALGGFDECFDYGRDDIEFFWRLPLAGYRLEHLPAAKVIYRLPATPWDAMRRGYTKGRATAQLYRSFAPHGARFRPVVPLRSCLGLFGRSYRLVRAAQPVGRVAGGIGQRRVSF